MKKMKAWVVSITNFDASRYSISSEKKCNIVVVSILSARNNIGRIKSYITNLYKDFYYSLQDQIDYSQYNNLRIKEEIKVHHPFYCQCDLSIIYHPYHIRAQLSTITDLSKEDDVKWLTWKGDNYTSYEIDSKTHILRKLHDIEIPEMTAPKANFRINNFFEL